RPSGQQIQCLELKHPLGVALIDHLEVLGWQAEAVEHLGDVADEERAAERIEGTVGAEEHVLPAEEIEAAARARSRAVDRRVAIEHAEIVDRAAAFLLHRLDDLRIALLAPSRVPSWSRPRPTRASRNGTIAPR